MSKKKNSKFITKDILRSSVINSFIKLNPKYMIKNPVMFVVEVGFFITVLLSIFPNIFGESVEDLRLYNIVVSVILFITVLFANFAEAVAEGRGKAQAETLKKTQKDTKARIVYDDGTEEIINASELKKGDIVLVKSGEIIPNDGEVIDGIASVDESAITGESAPVVKESGGDFASVTGGTTVASDWLKIIITSSPGESFLDKMINMVEGASRQKTPNEIALNTLLVSLTIIFLIVIVTLYPIAAYCNVDIPISTLIALTVCLIPTTIGGLLSAIGIAGMDRVTRFNVIAMSGKAVEACGDVDTMILDKTGTITYGNRLASKFIPVYGVSEGELIKYSVASSLKDDTPEGKSIVELGTTLDNKLDINKFYDATFIEFTAQTRMSGIDLEDGTKIRKGAADSIIKYVKEQNGSIPDDLENSVNDVSKLGGTPLVVSVDNKILGVIYLKDTVKPGLVERFARLREIGIKTIMCTGDNPLTAATIAQEAGVDGFIAECKPEDKIEAIKKEQAEGKIVAMTGDGTNDAPALAQANVGLAMNSGTSAAKEAANMVDLDSDPTKILEVVEIGKQLLITRGSLTTFSIANDVAKYFAIIPAIFMIVIPEMQILNIMKLATPESAILSALIFNAIIIPALIPLAMKGVKYKPMSSGKMLAKNMLIYGLGGVITPFIGIKIIDLIINPLLKIIGI
ncbi:potassium-transporting ATPase subunit KdpB [Clostridium sp. NSJ-6]|uniref:Potassium-transporting ATPase ATP-binding subunit n=1 Tax=Clostridium hominis TaxID=2763036 RepID=A0ABR7DGX0_9CLOT|nr:potassium-transporting ATPase subunit KdpB [Clostridium hominis]MBC5630654.1 potassium-transporting ATPase subunit KdpB [Clostridium hominis]MDU2670433.1 potassium-transporting ATPase subunit KdpB [Clostridium sp.]